MPGDLLMAGTIGTCPHGATVEAPSGSTRVSINHSPALRTSDSRQICGCSFMVVNKAQPCTTVQWVTTASRVFIEGQLAVLSDSQGICLSGIIPQGPPLLMSTQTRVRGA